MARNMGSLDRVVRLVAAVVLVVGALLAGAGTTLGVVLLVVAAVLAVTAAVGFCPLYRLLGLSTRPRTTATR